MAILVSQYQNNVTPLDALLSHFYSSSKSVQKAFAKIILESRAEDKKKSLTPQQKYVKESLTRAFDEVRNAKARGESLMSADDFLEELRKENE